MWQSSKSTRGASSDGFFLLAQFKLRAKHQERTINKQHPARHSCPADVVQAMTLLGVEPGATLEQVAVAYRHMAQMYHPDKTSGLGPEPQKLANERMKEINSAHQTVRQYLEHV